MMRTTVCFSPYLSFEFAFLTSISCYRTSYGRHSLDTQLSTYLCAKEIQTGGCIEEPWNVTRRGSSQAGSRDSSGRHHVTQTLSMPIRHLGSLLVRWTVALVGPDVLDVNQRRWQNLHGNGSRWWCRLRWYCVLLGLLLECSLDLNKLTGI
jgi:hypothetical protein